MSHDAPDGRTLVVNMFRMRPGVDPAKFAEFSAAVDQPLVTAHAEVVTRFDAYVVGGTTAEALDADIVEVLEVTDWDTWVRVRDNDPSLRPVMSGFDELVEPGSVRSNFVTPIPRGSTP
ncbi:hypothetical protein GCM10010472_65690 [Pseudonocardia halophobica]|uniref:Uncharacterized protein n=1 Tax=Pseudonocardia halophobica TaxID=29401 RepID=A0A9W6NY20_9PSEU|nr:hypothetical protein [Pseudonocardia halophobica]GLL14020.1 hypothetical protein GCM10017577_51650 [Pseudonocardia halophobica]